jgi:hypothetical protein
MATFKVVGAFGAFACGSLECPNKDPTSPGFIVNSYSLLQSIIFIVNRFHLNNKQYRIVNIIPQIHCSILLKSVVIRLDYGCGVAVRLRPILRFQAIPSFRFSHRSPAGDDSPTESAMERSLLKLS